MESKNNNTLRGGALISLFITSYIPLFVIIIAKQMYLGYDYLFWGGWNKDAFDCFISHFGMSVLLLIISIGGMVGILIFLHNVEKDHKNGDDVIVTKICNKNSDAIGYIATYIVPFFAGDFSDLVEWAVFMFIMIVIYVIYIQSNMILINPILRICNYSLLEIEYKVLGGSSDKSHDAQIITKTKDFKEDANYKIYQLGFKMYYGKES